MTSQVERLATLLEIASQNRQAWKAVKQRSHTLDRDSSMAMIAGTFLACIGALLLLIAFASPHWMESRLHAYSEFVKLGLWEVCFNNYYHHSFQFHYAFSGCHWVYSREYRVIYEFILPPWFLAVQGFMTISLILSLLSLLLLIFVYAHVFPKHHASMLAAVVGQCFFAGLCTLIAIVMFGIQAQDQRWMPHPLYNYYSWSFWFGFASLVVHCIAALILVKHVRRMQNSRPLLNTDRQTDPAA